MRGAGWLWAVGLERGLILAGLCAGPFWFGSAPGSSWASRLSPHQDKAQGFQLHRPDRGPSPPAPPRLSHPRGALRLACLTLGALRQPPVGGTGQGGGNSESPGLGPLPTLGPEVGLARNVFVQLWRRGPGGRDQRKAAWCPGLPLAPQRSLAPDSAVQRGAVQGGGEKDSER